MSTYCVALRRNNRAKVKQKELHAGGIIVPIISFQTEIREKKHLCRFVLFCFLDFFFQQRLHGFVVIRNI